MVASIQVATDELGCGSSLSPRLTPMVALKAISSAGLLAFVTVVADVLTHYRTVLLLDLALVVLLARLGAGEQDAALAAVRNMMSLMNSLPPSKSSPSTG